MNGVVIIFLLLCTIQVSGQFTSKDIEAIDSVFSHRATHSSPGYSLAITLNGSVVYTKGYGMANLEYEVPMTASTIFHIASESKKYTAFSIAMLASRGKLSINDDIRKYLPYVPDFGKVITIRHLLNHTSGLRDQWQALVISGWQMDDVITQDHILRLVRNQRELNFDPGERYLYSNTGYTLLAEIVEEVSGQSFREFCAENIFKPLGMSQTHVHDYYKEIVKNRADSYEPNNGQYIKSILSYSTAGATSVFTTVQDEAKWLLNIGTRKWGDKRTWETMLQHGRLNNGEALIYASGVSVDTYKGFTRISHGGGDAGFRTYSCYFPQTGLGIVLFSNLSTANPVARSMEIADMFLPGVQAVRVREVLPDNTRDFEGFYLSESLNAQVISSHDSLFLKTGSLVLPLVASRKNSFTALDGLISIDFDKPMNGKSSGFRWMLGSNEIYLKRHLPVKLSEKQMELFVGKYYSEELDVTYTITFRGGQLILTHRKFPDAYVLPITGLRFSTAYWWMENLVFFLDESGKVAGFEVDSGRIFNLKFKKISS